jgi:mannose-6-phosphate isomerase-like protein (cupin superfamily)
VSSNLSVKQERVPPGAGELAHFHFRAHQFFFVLSGEATLELEDGSVQLRPGQGVNAD